MKVMKQGIGGSLLFIAATAALVAGAAQAPRGQRGVDPRNSTFINGAPPETLPPILPAPAGNGQTGDRPQPVRVATGAIIGVVTRAGTMEGLSRARVELVPLELTGLDALAVLEPDPAAQKELRARNNYRTADADRDGRFLMSGVRPGRYTLIAEREGFIRSAYGQRGVNQYGSVVVVDPGKTVEVVVPMRPAPAVTGIVTDPVQAPVPAALVEAYRVRYTPIGRELKLAQTAVTGDRGEYRLAWLSPGDYYVAASYSSAYSASGSGLPRNPNIAIHDDGYRAMYFPGGPTLADARIVRVEGSDIDGINMAFQSSKVVSIKGRVAGVQSDFSSVQLTFLGSDGDPVPGLTYPHRVDASGQFEIRGVTPGDYKVFAKTRDGRLSSAIMSVRVPDRGVDRLDLAMEQGMWVSAQMDGVPWSFDLRICRLGAMDSGQKHCFDELTIPYKEGHFEPTFIPTDNLSVMLTLPSGFEVESTRFFRPMPPLSKLPPPRVELGQDGLSRGDMVRIANPFVPDAVSCRDDPPIYVQGCFEFTFGTPIAVGGRAINRLGEPVPGAQIVLVPRPGPRERVRPEGTGYVTTVTDASGQLQTSALAGTYVVLAFEEIEPGAYYAQDFLSRFERSGIVAPVGVISAARPGGRSDDPPPWMTLQIPVISRDEMLNR